MARRIDNGSQPTAHTAIQVMLERARQLAEANNVRVGLVYNLAEDQLSLIDVTAGIPEGVQAFKIVEPKAAETAVEASSSGTACAEESRATLKCEGDTAALVR